MDKRLLRNGISTGCDVDHGPCSTEATFKGIIVLRLALCSSLKDPVFLGCHLSVCFTALLTLRHQRLSSPCSSYPIRFFLRRLALLGLWSATKFFIVRVYLVTFWCWWSSFLILTTTVRRAGFILSGLYTVRRSVFVGKLSLLDPFEVGWDLIDKDDKHGNELSCHVIAKEERYPTEFSNTAWNLPIRRMASHVINICIVSCLNCVEDCSNQETLAQDKGYDKVSLHLSTLSALQSLDTDPLKPRSRHHKNEGDVVHSCYTPLLTNRVIISALTFSQQDRRPGLEVCRILLLNLRKDWNISRQGI